MDRDGFERSISTGTSLDPDIDDEVEDEDIIGEEDESIIEKDTTPLYPIAEGEEEEEEEEESGPRIRVKEQWRTLAGKSLSPPLPSSPNDEIPANGITRETKGEGDGLRGSSKWNRVRRVRLNDANTPTSTVRPTTIGLNDNRNQVKFRTARTPFLREGETHFVWRPKKRPQLANLVEMLKKQDEEGPSPAKTTPKEEDPVKVPRTPRPASKIGTSGGLTTPKPSSLRSRQQTLFNRVIATQAVLKETTDELLNDDALESPPNKPKHISLLNASKKVTANIKKQKLANDGKRDFSDIVSHFLTKSRSEEESKDSESSEGGAGLGKGWSLARTSVVPQRNLQIKRRDTRGAIPITTLREIVREEKLQTEALR